MSPLAFAWAAGFVDGEGYIAVSRKNPTYGTVKSGPRTGRLRRDGTTYQLVVLVTQKNPAPIDQLVALFGGVKTPCRRSNGTDYWRWRIGSTAACEALEKMLPFFVGKRDVAALAVSFQRWWQDGFPEMGRSMPPERRAGAAYYHAECRRLNRLFRGVPTTTGNVVEIDRGIAGPGSV